MDLPICFFEGCGNPVGSDSWRCAYHRGRDRCQTHMCRRQAYARKLCARHGGKRECSVDGCKFRARVGSLCARHGIKRRAEKCRQSNCDKLGQRHGVCIRHGGGKRCAFEGCTSYVRRAGYCNRHYQGLASPASESDSSDGVSYAMSPTKKQKESRQPIDTDEEYWDDSIWDVIMEL